MASRAPTSLSPSRAGDFKQCPLLYRLRTIDRLPEPPSPAMAKGTLVHAVLQELYELPAERRTPEEALRLLEPEWARLQEKDADAAALFEDLAAESEWLAQARGLVEAYFAVEDPRRLEPAEREFLVEAQLPDGPLLRGYVDRLDATAAGDLRVVDYKTGASPKPAFRQQALFQLKFYALVLWRSRGVVPRMLRLVYLKDATVVECAPDEDDLAAVERSAAALWEAIQRAAATGDFPPRRSKLCGWCAHQAACPEFGGTPPPYPLPVVDV